MTAIGWVVYGGLRGRNLHRWSLAEPGIKDLVGSLLAAEVAEVESNLASAWANRELWLVWPVESSSSAAGSGGVEGDLLQEEKPNGKEDIGLYDELLQLPGNPIELLGKAEH